LALPEIADRAVSALRNAGSYISDLATPTIRLGVTGLARSGKTVFITALVRNLTEGGRLPFFAAAAEGRILTAHLEPQPDDAVPRFDYEGHLAALLSDPPRWPESTRRISELRIALEFRPSGLLRRALRQGQLNIDIVDYPGEWLIDLGLLGRTFADWSQDVIAEARQPLLREAAAPWFAKLAGLDPGAPQDEQVAISAARLFTGYLEAARRTRPALSTLGPGRFLLPGDLEGSPLLTFAPLDIPRESSPARGSLAAMMERRYESYKARVVRPFFREHFSRLDRQIVLVDALEAVNAGPPAVANLTRSLETCLEAFRPGPWSWLTSIFSPRIDRVLFAATKADHLPSTSHDRLQALLASIIDKASKRAATAGAEVGVTALAALRATREMEVRDRDGPLACIRGVPLAGESLEGRTFDGTSEAAIFPGDLPANPQRLLSVAAWPAPVRFVRFRPPTLSAGEPWPHIRLDRALQFLLGDYLQ
jgi:predicted YcjX-like family ATPase